MSRSDYISSLSMTSVVWRLILTLAALAGFWVSFAKGDTRWEILFGVYMLTNSIEYAANKILFEIGKSR
jgi:hypothetical protein